MTSIPGSISLLNFLELQRKTSEAITPRTGGNFYLLIANCVRWKSTVMVMRASVAMPFGV